MKPATTDLDLHLAIASRVTRRLTRRRGVTPILTIAQIADICETTPAKIRTIETRAQLHFTQALRRSGLTTETLEAFRHHRHTTDQRS